MTAYCFKETLCQSAKLRSQTLATKYTYIYNRDLFSVHFDLIFGHVVFAMPFNYGQPASIAHACLHRPANLAHTLYVICCV